MIKSEDIYTFYLAEYLWYRLPRFGQFIIRKKMKKLQDKYIASFIELLKKQLEKYVSRRRVDVKGGMPVIDIEKIQGEPYAQARAIKAAMAQTYRSDMERRNEVWNSLANHLLELTATDSIRSIIFNIDRLNNHMHNSWELVMGKFQNAWELLPALKHCSKERNPMILANSADSDIQQLAMAHAKENYGLDMVRKLG